MSIFRERLIDRMIHLYGFEHEAVIDFCRICEDWPDATLSDKCLVAIVESHENHINSCGGDE